MGDVLRTTTGHEPDHRGHWGPFGGRFVPEALMAVVDEVTDAYAKARADEEYLAELDNWGPCDNPGRPNQPGAYWCWGYDEIGWFAHLPADRRRAWLAYAQDWIKKHDPAGHLQMPGGRVLHTPVDGKHWYYANDPSPAVPDGFGDESAIRAIWAKG